MKWQGKIEWHRYKLRGVTTILWKVKIPVLLLSTHAPSICHPAMRLPMVPQKNGAEQDRIPTSPMHMEYTIYMRHVDVTY